MSGQFRRGVLLSLAAALVAMSAGCAGPAASKDAGSTEENEPYKLGAVLSLTGTYAALGTSEKNAIELEVKRINDAGGINGRDLEVIIEDDATDEAKAVAAASRLIDQEQVLGILGATGTGQTMAMRSELKRANVPQISMAGGTVVTQDFDPLVFQTPWSNIIVVPFVLDAIKQEGHTKIALISDNGGYGKDGRDVVLSEAKQAGMEVVSDQTFNPGDTDMSAQLTKIKGSGAEALLLWTAGKEATTIVKNARDLGIDLPLYGGSGQARLEFAEGAGEAAEGFVFGTGKSLIAENWGDDTAQLDAVTDFATRYEAAYGEKPDIFAGHAFDAVSIVADALRRAGAGANSGMLREAIEATRGLPGFGGAFTYSRSDHNGLTSEDLALYRVEGGTWVSAE
ncbi:MAG TPA: ABC transporter substrate-binding protein [Coriobacteriia bacterium]|nr:ABC transporter substrate-binding protein [Coriobacteriia bacterium]